MAQIGAINVHGVTPSDVTTEWLRPQPDDTAVVADIRMTDGRISLFFTDRAEAARFFDTGAEQVTTLPDKPEAAG